MLVSQHSHWCQCVVELVVRTCAWGLLLSTRESHWQALREILPFFILILPPLLAILSSLILHVVIPNYLTKWISSVAMCSQVVLPLSFAIHNSLILLFIWSPFSFKRAMALFAGSTMFRIKVYCTTAPLNSCFKLSFFEQSIPLHDK